MNSFKMLNQLKRQLHSQSSLRFSRPSEQEREREPLTLNFASNKVFVFKQSIEKGLKSYLTNWNLSLNIQIKVTSNL